MGFKNILWQGSGIKQDSSNRLVTDSEKTTWNNKANNSHTHNMSQISDIHTYLYDATAKRTANTILAAPNGSDGVATFRKLVAADIPSLNYLPISGGTVSGDIGLPIGRSNIDGSAPYAGSTVTTDSVTAFSAYKTYLGTFMTKSGSWYDVISIRHRNGAADGKNYGLIIYTTLEPGGSLVYTKQAGGEWGDEKTILDSVNYTTYTVSKSGTGASGTWGINISGKANTAGVADSANSVAWGNVSGKPSTFTPSSHNHDTAYLKLTGGTMTGTLSLKNTGLQIISNLPEDFSGTPRGDRQVLWYSKEFEDDSYKYEDYCTHYINLGTPNSGTGNGKFGVDVQVRFYQVNSKYYTNIHSNVGVTSNISIVLPVNSGTLQVSLSDARLKTNIKDTEVNDAISFINRIHLHSFDWKTDDTHQSIGFIADELEELDKRLSVGGNSDRVDKNGLPMDPKCVNTFYLQGYEVKAIQELSSKIDALEKENDKLKDIINQLLEKVTTLESK